MALTLTPQEIQTINELGYQYVRPLGQGQYGLVILATKNERKVVLKVTKNITSFQSEVLMLTRLGEHPNIVQYHGSWSTRTLHGIVLEYLSGRSLLDILMENPLSEVRAHAYFRQLISAIIHAHEVAGVVHRDLKAENLMISSGGSTLYVIDWGMSIEWSSDARHSASCGSPDYAAPEIYKKKSYLGPEVDIWAMGVILYAMVTSNFPFPGSTPFEIGYRVCKGVYSPPAVSSEMCDLISKMLNPSQVDRITLAGIKEHPWFEARANMLTKSLGASQNLASSLHRSQYKQDVYAAPPVKEARRRRKSRTKSQARLKRYSGSIDKRTRPIKDNHIPLPPVETIDLSQKNIAAPSSSNSSTSSDQPERNEQDQSPSRSLRVFSLTSWKKMHQRLPRSSSSVLFKRGINRER